MYFFLVQSEQGDVFKLEADGDIVTEMRIKYFDTLPTANSMCILKTRFLFVASKFGNQMNECEFFQTLEMHMRVEFPPLCGRDHLAYRSFYAPVKSVFDCDLFEQFTMLESGKQRDLSKNLDMLPTMVIKKLEDLRTRYAF
ncbi:mono-functional DNA-alkylating methyl methanesulfonate n-term domain-containing protein [Ditylenchus destructor]|nr:mono-functional DNA-alkylating methyl methanesulfonate n-term domain-containing protein [Ditylenchus destructor]